MLTARDDIRSRPAVRTDAPPEGWLGVWTRGTTSWFRVWAPRAHRVEVAIDARADAHVMTRDADGYWTARIEDAPPGTLYRYRLDGTAYPDPCSRFQPQGPHGPSQVVDAQAFEWHDAQWRGIGMHGQVIYELHVGTFTPEGTLDAVIPRLEGLRALGITVVELMPLAEFPGRWNWGYDGVDLFAPYHGYGDYDALKRLVDAAHALGMAVILDVVYNHVGPDGNYLGCFSADYFTDRYQTDWGQALNFDGEHCAPVRDFFIRNAAYWIGEFHLDGLRMDATQNIYDATRPHVVAEIARAARAAAAPRSIIVTTENEPKWTYTLAPAEQGGWGIDALWNDDFHHSARVAIDGRRHGYFLDYRGRAAEFVAALKRGFLYQGQHYQWQKQSRGDPVRHEPAQAFIAFLENHDQISNALLGTRVRLIGSPARYRALTAVLLLGPHTPLLFMGQEFGATSPFLFFADHEPDLAAKVHAGRRQFMAQFPAYATAEAQRQVADPGSEATMLRCKLDAINDRDAGIESLYRDLLKLRRDDPVIAAQRRDRLDGAVLSEHAFAMRWFDDTHGDRLLVVNLGADLDFRPAPEPLLAPPRGMSWALAWSSDEPRYGATGVQDPCRDDGWYVTANSATLFTVKPAD